MSPSGRSSPPSGGSNTKVRTRTRHANTDLLRREAYRVYADALARALGGLRPEAEVAVCRLAEIDDQLESFDPNLVVSSRPNTVDPGGRAAWYRLSPEPDEPSEACLGGERTRRHNPPQEELLSFIDDVEALVRSGREVGGC
jgi:hypothetical protein